jgi:hypothetical protein
MAAKSQMNPEKVSRPADEVIRSMLARILASPEFHRAARLRAFLEYVVERTLAGNPEDITETLIGHRVFGRPVTYNPGDDSIVRTEARTLRQRLERYFSTEGAGEPIILEIPRGGYLPVFHPRPTVILPSLPLSSRVAEAAGGAFSRRRLLAMGGTAAGIAGLGVWGWRTTRTGAQAEARSVAPRFSDIRLESSDPVLTAAFERARERALACVFTGDPVGDWYASTRDNRAFCIRDTAHEDTGAALLGLFPQSLNMLRRFAAVISKSRRWCSYWIITKDGFPSPLEYTDDKNFNYVLPANFDLLCACHRQLLWTGDNQYLDPVFSGFFDRTVSHYVQAWDPDHDGIMKSADDQPRVAASYNQQAPHFLTGADLVAAQYAGYLAYAAIQEIKGGQGSLSQQIAAEYRGRAEDLRRRFNEQWWDPEQSCFRSGLMPDHSWWTDYVAPCRVYPLKFGIVEDGLKTQASLDLIERNRPPFNSTYSYYPEVLYRYGRNDSAYQHLLEISDPAFSGYQMAETAFAAIGSIGTGLMGIEPDAPHAKVQTMPRLAKDTHWVRLTNVPVAGNRIGVEHRGNSETRFTNQSGTPLTWKAIFPIPPAKNSAGVFVDGVAAEKLMVEHRPNSQLVLCASVVVKAGQTRLAKLAL